MGEREQRLTTHLTEAHRLMTEALDANARRAPCSVRYLIIKTWDEALAALDEATALCEFAFPPK